MRTLDFLWQALTRSTLNLDMKIPLNSFILALSIWCSAVFSQTCDTLIVTGPPAGPPSSWLHNGTLMGASIDFVKTVALAAGAKSVVVKPFDTWAQALRATESGEVDLLLSAAYSKERARYMTFIEPHYSGQFVYVIVLNGKEFPIRQYADLKGRKGMAAKGETYGSSKFGSFVQSELSLERADSVEQAFKTLLAGKVDYIFSYENSANSEIFKLKIGESVSIAKTYPFYAETFMAVSKRSKCSSLNAELSKQIEIAKKSHLFYSLTEKYQSIFFENFDSSQR
jgi:polar amino acid transport system substrate-binding protein